MHFVYFLNKKIIMKKAFWMYVTAIGMGIFSSQALKAQDTKPQDTTTIGQDLEHAGKKTGQAVAKGAKDVGNKTAEIASKGKAGVVDKIYDGKEGPEGQTIYINNKSEYYWIDKQGHRHFLPESELKDKKN